MRPGGVAWLLKSSHVQCCRIATGLPKLTGIPSFCMLADVGDATPFMLAKVGKHATPQRAIAVKGEGA